MRALEDIAKDLYAVCYDVDRNITGHPDEDAAAWARANSARHAHTVRAILAHARTTGRKEIKVLNASGMSCGHQDFSIVDYIRRRTDIALDWTAFESPKSRYPAHEVFHNYMKRLGIFVELSDFSKPGAMYGEGRAVYDVVVFTEIAEHLDHTTLLRALAGMREMMKDDGTIVLTTPNLVSLVNRIRVLSGNGDGPYFGDGELNRERGLYGHVAIYDARRMTRLLRDAGCAVREVHTFNSYFCRPFRRAPRAWAAVRMIGAATRLIANAGGTLFITAGKGEPVPIPFEI